MLTVESYQNLKQLGHSDRQVQDLLSVSEDRLKKFKKLNRLTRPKKHIPNKYHLSLSLLGDGSLTSKYGELRQQGYLDRQICVALNIPRHTLNRWKSRANIIEIKPRKLHLLTVPDYQQHLRDGLGDTEIANLFGVTDHAVRQWRKRNGVPAPKLRRYPPTPAQLPDECLEAMQRLYPVLQEMRESEVRSAATAELARCVWIFHCRANEGTPLSHKEQASYMRRVSHRCLMDFFKHRQTLTDTAWALERG